jgi:fructokinase
MHTQQIVGAGLIALDVLVDENNRVISSSLGGSAGNVLAILSSLGWSSMPVVTLGEDRPGALLAEELDALGVDVGLVRRSPTCQTPVVYQHQLSNSSGATHKFSFECPFCGNRTSPNPSLDRDLVDCALSSTPTTDVFFFDRPSLENCILAEAYASTGALIIFEPSSAGKDEALFSRALRVAHIVKYANDRFGDLQEYNLESALVEIRTLGAEGLKFRAPSLSEEWFTLGAYNLSRIKDTAGAGDWCTAGFVYKLYDDFKTSTSKITYGDLVEALSFGQVLSSLNCMTTGARGLLKAFHTHEIKHIAESFSKHRLEKEYKSPLAQCIDGTSLLNIFSEKKKLSPYTIASNPDAACCTYPGKTTLLSPCR